MNTKFWCEDHLYAAISYADRYPQYKRYLTVAKKYKAKRNIGRPGETWVRKGEIVLGYKHQHLVSTNPCPRYEDAITVFSGHARFKPEWSIGWCISSYPDAFIEVE
jgi:hypothetical protein